MKWVDRMNGVMDYVEVHLPRVFAVKWIYPNGFADH